MNTTTINEFDHVEFEATCCGECTDAVSKFPHTWNQVMKTAGVVIDIDGDKAEVWFDHDHGNGDIRRGPEHYAIIPLAELTVLP